MTSSQVAEIDPEESCVTLVNVYEVEREKQIDLVLLLSKATEGTIRHEPGCLSVSIHSSLDGQRVVNYAQWGSVADFEALMKKRETQTQLKQFAALANSVSPGLYRFDAVHAGA